jgi:hypothetical protein
LFSGEGGIYIGFNLVKIYFPLLEVVVPQVTDINNIRVVNVAFSNFL